ncbi:MAG: hypothetical protein Tsb0013_17720 [Phycisphaerales bacterium]
MSTRIVTALGATALLASVAAADGSGNIETYMGDFALTTTNWDEAFSIPGFDTMGGDRVLKQIRIMLTGDVTGNAFAESLDAEPADINLFLQATLQLELTASGTVLSEVIPVANETFMASAYDGMTDFGGTSGASFTGLNGSAMVTDILDSPSILANFIDVASVDLTADANGTSTGTGAGNLITQFATSAGLSWKVEYIWTPAPAGLAAFGVLGLGALRRRR